MSFENPSSAKPNRSESSVSIEKEIESKLFKGLLALGAGVLSTGWEAATTGGIWQPKSKELDNKGFFGLAAERIKSVYNTLDNAEQIVDPKGRITLYDVFDKFMELSGKPENASEKGGVK